MITWSITGVHRGKTVNAVIRSKLMYVDAAGKGDLKSLLLFEDDKDDFTSHTLLQFSMSLDINLKSLLLFEDDKDDSTLNTSLHDRVSLDSNADTTAILNCILYFDCR